MRKSDRLLLLYVVLSGLFLLSLADTTRSSQEGAERIDRTRRMVAELGLTDPALFTEARYTRHLSQADLHSAFQDHPMALEHFPSGSLLLPPQRSQP
ncbi:hypothetical protein [Sedimenticola selenatireducens]|uniref:Uncharacterized protein n=1 Tax=Sedimenticola selenatireducens TaxID=191960 RepID=A0A2N6CV20_9GAMM|nr:hypothetical protein [Sedimenticola selenatireducens]PLX61034.1 MAG: hypothetical protein C0630_13035 [Sedimenticola selenatireducens]